MKAFIEGLVICLTIAPTLSAFVLWANSVPLALGLLAANVLGVLAARFAYGKLEATASHQETYPETYDKRRVAALRRWQLVALGFGMGCGLASIIALGLVASALGWVDD
jgi:hypothetical protein